MKSGTNNRFIKASHATSLTKGIPNNIPELPHRHTDTDLWERPNRRLGAPWGPGAPARRPAPRVPWLLPVNTWRWKKSSDFAKFREIHIPAKHKREPHSQRVGLWRGSETGVRQYSCVGDLRLTLMEQSRCCLFGRRTHTRRLRIVLMATNWLECQCCTPLTLPSH